MYMGAKSLVTGSKKISRYLQALESSPHLLDQLKEAAEESLSLRDEVAAARTILGESMRMLGRATSENNGVMPQSVAAMVLGQLREVNSLVSSCANIEARRQDQQLDVAKLVLLLGRLRDDLRLSLKEAGLHGAVPFIDAAFARAKWTGALDDAAVQEALSAPLSFDVKFRPIERDASGKLLEHKQSFDTPEEALTNAKDLDLTTRSSKLADKRVVTPLKSAEDEVLKKELEQTNNMLDAEIDTAQEEGNPLPGAAQRREDKQIRRMIEGA